MPPRVTAADAMNEAREAKSRLESHEDICAERYKRIFDTLGELKLIAKWAASAVAGIAVSLIAWMAVQLYTLNNARIEALEGPAVVHPVGR